jgi:arylsulfatase A
LIRNAVLVVLLCSIIFLAACGRKKSSSQANGVRPPNFIIIFTDDLGYDDLGCFWTPNDEPGYEKIDTPNIDQMAAEGVRFTDFYVAGPVCTPSRGALLTGCYPARIGLARDMSTGRGVIDAQSRVGLNPNEITIAEVLKPRGYATACIGKWHLGHQPEFWPTRQGFDLYFGSMYRHKDSNPIMRGENIVEYIPDSLMTPVFTRATIDFIRENKDHPFFIYLATTMPHVPLAVTAEFRGKSKRGLYGDVVMALDAGTGKIVQTLRDLGLDSNTVVVFTSDNGPAVNMGDQGGKAFPLEAGKARTSEGGLRVPCVMWWPGHIPAGGVCHELATTMDLLPTFAYLAGADVPHDRIIDGINIWPLMDGTGGPEAARPSFFYYHEERLDAVRSGYWKLTFTRNNVSPDSGSPEEAKPRTLYDLQDDISEQHDVLKMHPDVVQHLAELADSMRADIGDENTGQTGRNRRPCGFAENGRDYKYVGPKHPVRRDSLVTPAKERGPQ